jgi:hypothetical protein
VEALASLEAGLRDAREQVAAERDGRARSEQAAAVLGAQKQALEHHAQELKDALATARDANDRFEAKTGIYPSFSKRNGMREQLPSVSWQWPPLRSSEGRVPAREDRKKLGRQATLCRGDRLPGSCRVLAALPGFTGKAPSLYNPGIVLARLFRSVAT